MNMLSFLQILIDNYDGSAEMKNNIMNNKINIYKCKENVNADELIKFYKEYNIIEKNIALDNPTVPDPGPSVPPTNPTDPSDPSTTCCSVCSNFEVTDDETDPDALIINIVDKDTTTP